MRGWGLLWWRHRILPWRVFARGPSGPVGRDRSPAALSVAQKAPNSLEIRCRTPAMEEILDIEMMEERESTKHDFSAWRSQNPRCENAPVISRA